jgi:hypothetical protein
LLVAVPLSSLSDGRETAARRVPPDIDTHD